MVDKKAVTVKVTSGTPLPAAEGANFFHFTSVGGEVQMLVGTVNLLRLHDQAFSGETAPVTADITHRFLLSPLGFAHLKKQLDEIASSVLAPPGVTISDKGGRR